MTLRILILGHSEGFGGSQTAFRRLVEVLAADTAREIATIDIGDKSWEPQLGLALGHLKWRTAGLFGKLRKRLQLSRVTKRAQVWAPDVLVSVGLNRSFAHVARRMGSCYRIGQEFIADRAASDPLLREVAQAYSAIAVQAPSMVARAQANLGETLPVSWLPCFPAPVVASAVQVGRARRNNAPRYVYFGRLAENKGLDLLVRAFGAGGFKNGQSLDIWGDGPVAYQVRALITELGLAGQVRLMGRYPDGVEGATLLASYDAVMLASREMEGLPLILLEAMAYGLAIVATDVGALPDAGHGLEEAWFVRPEIEALVGAWRELDKKLCNRTVQVDAILKHYEKSFSEAAMQTRWDLCLKAPKQFFHS